MMYGLYTDAGSRLPFRAITSRIGDNSLWLHQVSQSSTYHFDGELHNSQAWCYILCRFSCFLALKMHSNSLCLGLFQIVLAGLLRKVACAKPRTSYAASRGITRPPHRTWRYCRIKVHSGVSMTIPAEWRNGTKSFHIWTFSEPGEWQFSLVHLASCGTSRVDVIRWWSI